MAKNKRSVRGQVRRRDLTRRDDSREQRGKDLREKLTTTKSWFPLYGREYIRDEEGNSSWGDVERKRDWLTDFILGSQNRNGEPVPFDPVKRDADRSGYWGTRRPVLPEQKVMDNPLPPIESGILAVDQLGKSSSRPEHRGARGRFYRSLQAALAREQLTAAEKAKSMVRNKDTVDGYHGRPDENQFSWRTRPVPGSQIDELPPVPPYHIPRRRETLRRRK